MGRINLVAVGKKHNSDLIKIIEEYTTRLSRFAQVTWEIVPAAKGTMNEWQVRKTEAATLMQTFSNKDSVVLLDEIGSSSTSVQFSEILQNLMLRGERIVFIIGGAYGVADSIKERADYTWSLSKLTFPHQTVRLLLVEQLYRAFTILEGLPYHHQ